MPLGRCGGVVLTGSAYQLRTGREVMESQTGELAMRKLCPVRLAAGGAAILRFDTIGGTTRMFWFPADNNIMTSLCSKRNTACW